MTDDQNWRLHATLDRADGLGAFVERLHGTEEVLGYRTGGVIAADVTVTHDGNNVFAYAVTQAAIDTARAGIEGALRGDGRSAAMVVSRWDDEVGVWRQVEPPLTGEARELDEARVVAAEQRETRSFECFVSRFEGDMFAGAVTRYAAGRGVDCAVTQERHLVRAQLTFSLTGPAHRIDDVIDHTRRLLNAVRWIPGGAGGP